MYRTGALVGALMIAGGGLSYADRTMTLDEALALARNHNRDLRGARERIAMAEAGVEEARAALLPQVGVQGKYTHNYKEVDFNFGSLVQPTIGVAEAIRNNGATPAQAAALQAIENEANAEINSQPPVVIIAEEELDAGISATVPLIAPPAYFGLAAAHRGKEASEAGYQVNEASVLLGVAQAYFAAAGTDELVLARQDAVKVATETFDVAKARVAAELANQVESTRAETALIRARQDLTEAENARNAAYRALVTLIGVKQDTFTVQKVEAIPAEPGQLEQLVSEGEAHRPELVAQRATIAQYEATARAASWRWSPTLSAFGNFHVENYIGFSGDKYGWALGVELDWALFDGGARDAQRHLAVAQRKEAEAKLELIGDTVSDEVANARGTLETKRKGVGSAQRAVELGRETLRLVRAQYEAGAAKQLDVLEAQDVLVSAEVALAQAHFDVSLADLQLRRAAGEFPAKLK